MEKSKYLQAKNIIEEIKHIESMMSIVSKFKERENDEEFNVLRTGYYTALKNTLERLNDVFQKL